MTRNATLDRIKSDLNTLTDAELANLLINVSGKLKTNLDDTHLASYAKRVSNATYKLYKCIVGNGQV